MLRLRLLLQYTTPVTPATINDSVVDKAMGWWSNAGELHRQRPCDETRLHTR
jgi:hypothetical protein